MQQRNNKNKFFMQVLADIMETHRQNSNKSIYLASAESSIAKSNWREIELGDRTDINLSTFCKIAEGLDIAPWDLLKELCQKLGDDFSFTDIDT